MHHMWTQHSSFKLKFWLSFFYIKVWILKFEIEIYIMELVLKFGFEVWNEDFSFKFFDLINYLINLKLNS
jgi:hypothetical protein